MAQFTNQAQLSYNGITVNSNIALGEISEALAVSKTALSTSYTRDDCITYVVSLVNSSTANLTALTLTDNMGAYDYEGATLYPLTYTDGSVKLFVNGQLQGTPTVSSTSPLVLEGINVPAGGNAVLIYGTLVNSAAPLDVGSSVTNTASVGGAPLTSAVSASETVTALAAPELSITKSVEPVPVAANGRVTYTFIIQNRGNTAAVADDNVILRDVFDPVLTALSATLGGTPLTEGTSYTYSADTGVFTTLPGVIAVPAASYSRDAESGLWTVSPSAVTLTVSGNIAQ